MEGSQQSIAKRPARCRKARSSLVRRPVQAKDDPAKQRVRRWASDISDGRLLSLGLTPEDIALLRVSRGTGNFVCLLLMCARSVPSPTRFTVLEHCDNQHIAPSGGSFN